MLDGGGLQFFPTGQGSAALRVRGGSVFSSVQHEDLRSSAAVRNKGPFDGVFGTLPRSRKHAKVAAHSSARVLAHSTGTAWSGRPTGRCRLADVLAGCAHSMVSTCVSSPKMWYGSSRAIDPGVRGRVRGGKETFGERALQRRCGTNLNHGVLAVLMAPDYLKAQIP